MRSTLESAKAISEATETADALRHEHSGREAGERSHQYADDGTGRRLLIAISEW
jgi:hypothetical protein